MDNLTTPGQKEITSSGNYEFPVASDTPDTGAGLTVESQVLPSAQDDTIVKLQALPGDYWMH